MLERLHKYARLNDLSQAEDAKSLILPCQDQDEEAAGQLSPSRHVLSVLYVSLLWVLSIAIALFAGAWLGSRRNIDNLCIKHVSQYCTDARSLCKSVSNSD